MGLLLNTYRTIVAAASDPYWSKTVLAMHMETLADLSTSNLTVLGGTFTEGKFGSGANGFGVAYSPKLNFGSGDGTVEFFFKTPAAFTDWDILLGRYQAGYQAGLAWFIRIMLAADGTYVLGFDQPGVNTGLRPTGHPLSVNTWYHAALVKSGAYANMFLDGIQTSSTTSTLYFPSDSTYPIMTGARFLDEVRITQAARYSSNFTPLTAPFPTQ